MIMMTRYGAGGRGHPVDLDADTDAAEGARLLLALARGTGMRRLDGGTLEEFARRAGLYQEHVAQVRHMRGVGAVPVGYDEIAALLPDGTERFTFEVKALSDREFDRMIDDEIEAQRRSRRFS